MWEKNSFLIFCCWATFWVVTLLSSDTFQFCKYVDWFWWRCIGPSAEFNSVKCKGVFCCFLYEDFFSVLKSFRSVFFMFHYIRSSIFPVSRSYKCRSFFAHSRLILLDGSFILIRSLSFVLSVYFVSFYLGVSCLFILICSLWFLSVWFDVFH